VVDTADTQWYAAPHFYPIAMYSTLQRLQNVTSLATSFVLALLFGISLSSYLTIPQVELGSIEVNKLDM
jgi:hypothetical protein